MPKTMKAIAGHGTTFDQSIVSSPLCCPSRAGFLTGEYPHNSGVFDNEPGYAALIDKTSIIYPWLQAAGYRTGHIGRYLLNYDRATPPGGDWQTDGGLDAPPGLDDWFGYVGAPTHLQRRHLQRQRHPGGRGLGQVGLRDPGDEPPRARLHPPGEGGPAPVLPHARPHRPPRRPDHRPRPVRRRRPADPRRRQAGQVERRAASQAAVVRRAQRLRQAGLDPNPSAPRPPQARRPEARLALLQRQPRDASTTASPRSSASSASRATSTTRRSSSPRTTATSSASTGSSSTRSTPTRRRCGCRWSPACPRRSSPARARPRRSAPWSTTST